MLYYLKKGKNASESQKKICVVYEEGAVTGEMYQKFAKFCTGDFSLDCTPCLDRPVEVHGNQIETLRKSTLSQVEDSQHTQNIQINKVIFENEKCVFFYRKNHTDFLADPI